MNIFNDLIDYIDEYIVQRMSAVANSRGPHSVRHEYSCWQFMNVTQSIM